MRLEPVAPAVCTEVIFTLLVGLRVWDDWFELGGTNSCRTLSLSKGLPGSTWWEPGQEIWDWNIRRSYIALARESLVQYFPSLSRSPYPTERGEFLQGRGTIVAEFGNVLTELLQTGWLTRWVWRN